MSEVEITIHYNDIELTVAPVGWYYILKKPLGPGWSATTKGGPYDTEAKAELEGAWKKNEWERDYED